MEDEKGPFSYLSVSCGHAQVQTRLENKRNPSSKYVMVSEVIWIKSSRLPIVSWEGFVKFVGCLRLQNDPCTQSTSWKSNIWTINLFEVHLHKASCSWPISFCLTHVPFIKFERGFEQSSIPTEKFRRKFNEEFELRPRFSPNGFTGGRQLKTDLTALGMHISRSSWHTVPYKWREKNLERHRS